MSKRDDVKALIEEARKDERKKEAIGTLTEEIYQAYMKQAVEERFSAYTHAIRNAVVATLDSDYVKTLIEEARKDERKKVEQEHQDWLAGICA